MPLIVVLATGGTISSRDVGGGGAVATDGARDVLERAGASDDAITVEAIDLMRKNSFALTMEDLRVIAQGIRVQLARPEVDGIVVTHGTDTVEESAYLAELVHDDARPVVFTGAQVAADQEASDGPRNLRDAIAVAACPEARGLGVLLSFAGEIFAACGLRKQRALAPAPFDNAISGRLGRVSDGTVRISAQPLRAAPLPFPSREFGGIRVDIVLAYPGADANFVDAAISAGARGILIAGAGTGNTNHDLVRAISAARASGIAVGLGSRTGFGPVAPRYGGGGAVDAVAAGAIPIGALPVTQARILLALLLDHLPVDEVPDRLDAYCAAL